MGLRIEGEKTVAKKDASTVQSVIRSLHLLEIISREQKIGISELARQSNLKKTSVARLADTLEQAGFVEQDPVDKRYSLTVKLFEIGSRSLGLDIRIQARPLIRQFVNEHSMSVLLSVLDGHEVLYVDKIEAQELFRIMLSVGARGPAHCTASGKAMFAFIEPRRVREILGILPSFTPNTLTDYDSLAKDLAGVRTRGYSLDRSERHADLCSAGAPIFNSANEVIAAVSVPRMATITDSELAALGERVALLAREISERRGWRGTYPPQTSQ